MKNHIFCLLIIAMIMSCKKQPIQSDKKFVSSGIDSILNVYVTINKLRQKVGKDSMYLSKQSYELDFIKKENDTLLIIGRIPFYASNFFATLSNSFLENKLGLVNVKLTENPIYMGSFQFKNNPVHIYDVRDKVGKKEYFFDNLKTEDFKEYYITDMFVGDTMASFWIYKVKNNKFILEKKTKSYLYQ